MKAMRSVDAADAQIVHQPMRGKIDNQEGEQPKNGQNGSHQHREVDHNESSRACARLEETPHQERGDGQEKEGADEQGYEDDNLSRRFSSMISASMSSWLLSWSVTLSTKQESTALSASASISDMKLRTTPAQ